MTFQLFPSLDPAVEAALRESIGRFGVLVPVIYDQHDRLLDGHNRQRIAEELEVECPFHVVNVEDDAQAEEIVKTINLDRRHLHPEQRREIAAALRANGHSERAIAGALGVSQPTVHRDLEATDSPESVPDRIVGRDGKSRPARRPPIVVPVEDDEEAISPEEMQAILDELDDAHGDDLTEEIIDQAVEDNRESKRTPRLISKPDLGGGVSHPARFSRDLLPKFAQFLEAGWHVLDPFAGVGGIHDLRQLVDIKTVGVELEPEWAEKHPDTQVGSALDLQFDDEMFDAIVTSPTYGNRLADHHEASDPEKRRTYRHDLGRALSADNSGSLQWGPKYRDFHLTAWEEALRVLRPGGRFVLNIKDHIRDGRTQYVSDWHLGCLRELGCVLVDSDRLAPPHLRFGSNAEARAAAELVLVFSKETGR